MNKFFKNVMISSVLVGTFLSSGLIAHATDNPDSTVNKKFETKINFRLSPQDTRNHVVPVMPNINGNNSNYMKPDNKDAYNQGTGDTGPLTLDAVPYDMNFQTQTINSGQNNYNLNLNKTSQTSYPMTQVSDRRDGGNHNWNLSASLSIPSKNNGGIVSEIITMPILNNNNQAIAAYGTDNSNNPTVNNNLELASGNEKAVPVMTADKNNGAGTWANFFDSNKMNLNLKVQPNQIKSNQDTNQSDFHQSVITWNLTDSPNVVQPNLNTGGNKGSTQHN